MNSDLIFNASSITPALCTTCLLPMKNFVHHPTQKATMYCVHCRDKYKLNYKELLNVNLNGFKDARVQYKDDWKKLD